MAKIPKDILETLKGIAEHLEPVPHYFWQDGTPKIQSIFVNMSGHDLIVNKIQMKDGSDIDPDKMYKVETVQDIDHFKKLKKIYRKKGYQGVEEYKREITRVSGLINTKLQ